MALGEHLKELRYRIIVSALGVLAGAIVAFVFRHDILNFITKPYCHLPQAKVLTTTNGSCTLVISGVLDAFTLSLKISINVGIIATAPIWLWQLWRFVTPGLRSKERKYVLSFVTASTLLFAAGAAVAYITLPKGLQFLLGIAGHTFTPLIQADKYISFLLAMILIFGLAFEFPLLVVMLNVVGVASAKKLQSIRRPVIFGVFVFAAVATPSQDPYTMTALAIPMCILYEVAILIARVHDKRVNANSSEPDYEKLDDEQASTIPSPAGI